MKRRYLYLILFGVPGLILAAIIAVLAAGMAAGVLWIFVFGDNPWPPVVESVLPILVGAVFLVVWIAILVAGFMIGKRQEQKPKLNKTHILASAGITTLFVLFIVFYELSVGNLGPKSDSLRCGEYCSQKGYPASSFSSQTVGGGSCSCLDQSGVQVIQVPMESIK